MVAQLQCAIAVAAPSGPFCTLAPLVVQPVALPPWRMLALFGVLA